MKYSSAVKKNEVLMHAMTWRNPINTLSERSQTQKGHERYLSLVGKKTDKYCYLTTRKGCLSVYKTSMRKGELRDGFLTIHGIAEPSFAWSVDYFWTYQIHESVYSSLYSQLKELWLLQRWSARNWRHQICKLLRASMDLTTQKESHEWMGEWINELMTNARADIAMK